MKARKRPLSVQLHDCRVTQGGTHNTVTGRWLRCCTVAHPQCHQDIRRHANTIPWTALHPPKRVVGYCTVISIRNAGGFGWRHRCCIGIAWRCSVIRKQRALKMIHALRGRREPCRPLRKRLRTKEDRSQWHIDGATPGGIASVRRGHERDPRPSRPAVGPARRLPQGMCRRSNTQREL